MHSNLKTTPHPSQAFYMKNISKTKQVYIAHPDYLSDLCEELNDVIEVHGNLVFSHHNCQPAFAQDIWYNPHIITFESINQAAQHLKQQNLRWFANPVEAIRRMTLIAEKLKIISTKKQPFPPSHTIPKISAFSLLDSNTLIYSIDRWKALPNGEYHFEEDKINPPNRAYLKLWEAFSILNHCPRPGDKAIDLGASPGGWTYVMQSLGTHVLAVDKAPLDPRIAQLPHVKTLQESAFALEPSACDPVDWLICDVACYPERLYTLINKWIASKKAKYIIATIKLQGKNNFDVIRQFQAIHNGRVLHLFNNKHELTFFYEA